MTVEEAREFFIRDRFAMVTTGIEIEDVDENYSKCSFKIEDKHLAVHNGVMGGAIYTLADFAFAVASNSETQLTVTTSSNISYLGQAKDDILIGECKCIKNGKRTCLFETVITDGKGTLVAHVISNGMHIEK